MLLHEINYNYEQLLVEFKKRILTIQKQKGYTSSQRSILVTATTDFFYQLADNQPDASRDVTAFLNSLPDSE